MPNKDDVVVDLRKSSGRNIEPGKPVDIDIKPNIKSTPTSSQNPLNNTGPQAAGSSIGQNPSQSPLEQDQQQQNQDENQPEENEEEPQEGQDEQPEEEQEDEDRDQDKDDKDEKEDDKEEEEEKEDDSEEEDQEDNQEEESDEEGQEEGEEEPQEEGGEEEPQTEEPAEGEPTEGSGEPEANGPESTTPETGAPEAGAPEAGVGETSAAGTGAEAGTAADAASAGTAGAGAEAAGAGAAEAGVAGTAAAGEAAGAGAAAAGTGAAATGAAATGATAAGTAAAGAAGTAAAAGGTAAAAGGTAAAGAGIAAGGWIVILVVIALVLIIIIILAIASIFHRSGSNTEVPQNKQNIDYIESSVISGKAGFVSSDDLEQIKKGNISTPSLQAMAYLVEKHEFVKYNYSLDEKITSATTSDSPLRSNAPFEFDIAALDKIKCIDTKNSDAKAGEFDINFAVNFNWNEYLAGKDALLCAVGYYPKIESKQTNTYLDKYGPGEFLINEIATMGPKAAYAKTIQAASEIIENKNNYRIDPADKESVVPTTLVLPVPTTSPLYLEVQSLITAANSNAGGKVYLKSDKEMPYALHIEFFNEPTDEQIDKYTDQDYENYVNKKTNEAL